MGTMLPLLDVPSLPQRGPSGIRERMSDPMPLWGKVIWVSFHQFWLISAWAMTDGGGRQPALVAQ